MENNEALIPAERDPETGRFTPKPSPTFLAKRQATKEVLHEVVQRMLSAPIAELAALETDTVFEGVLKAQLELAANPGEKTASASVKSFENVSKMAGLFDDSQQAQENTVRTINLGISPEMFALILARDGGVLKEYVPQTTLRTPAFLEGEFVSDISSTPATVKIAPVEPTVACRCGACAKQELPVGWLYDRNPSAMKSATDGLTIAAIIRKGDQESLPLRVTPQGVVLQAGIKLAAAAASGHTLIECEVET